MDTIFRQKEKDIEYLYIIDTISSKKFIFGKVFNILHLTSTTNIYLIMNQKFIDKHIFIIQHDWLRHPRSIMIQKIIENSHQHLLKNLKIFQFDESSCVAYSQGKLIIKSSPTTVETKYLTSLKHIQGDTYGPIHQSCGLFRYNRHIQHMVSCVFIINL